MSSFLGLALMHGGEEITTIEGLGPSYALDPMQPERDRTMTQRLDYGKAAPGALNAMYGLEKYLTRSSVEHPLRELVKMRVSQINGCAYCIDMHSKDARAAGETEQRLYGLSAWRETPFYTDRERAALVWAEALTLISETLVPDEVYEQARQHFSEQELVDLTLAVVAINGWNRIAISFRLEPGTYQPAPSRKPPEEHKEMREEGPDVDKNKSGEGALRPASV